MYILSRVEISPPFVLLSREEAGTSLFRSGPGYGNVEGIVNLHMSLSSTGANSAVAPPKM